MRVGIRILTIVLCLPFLVQGQIPLFEDYIVVKNETAINSKHLEYSPAFYEDGLVFISTRVAGPKYDIEDKNIHMNIMSIYRAKRGEDGALLAPEVFSEELLSTTHEGPLTFDRTNEVLYFTRNNTDKKTGPPWKLKIYSSDKVGGKWQNLRELPFNDSNFETCHPAISVENDALYFSSDREGGYGGMDLWVSYRRGDDWEEPVNLGASVNTSGNEIFPFIHADGTLYFASTGHGGEGNLDIFMASKAEGLWGEVVNLGKPFNSEFDDFGIIVDRDNKNGYFSSNRKDGLGGDDIYSFNIRSDGVFAATGKKDRKKDSVKIEIKDKDTGEALEGATVTSIYLDDLLLGEAIAGDGKEPGVLRLVPSGDGNTYQLAFDGLAAATPDENGSIALYEGNQVLKIEKDGYIPQYITVNEEMIKSGLKLQMKPSGNCIPFSVSVFDENGRNVQIGAQVILTEVSSGKQVTLTTDVQGSAGYCLDCNGSYSVMATKGGIVSNITTILTRPCDETKRIATTLYLNAFSAPVVEGTVIQLPNIYFNFNDAALRPDAKVDLDAVVAFMNLFPHVQVELASHTDARGTDRYNTSLSQQRSESVMQYLLSKGIDAGRMVAKGYGEQQARNRCVDGVRCSEEEHQKNRRTELVITNAGKKAVGEQQEEMPPIASVGIDDVESPEVEHTAGVLYFVIAGTFENMDYAVSRLSRLKDLGYVDTEIVKLTTDSPYQAVCVGKYEDDSHAKMIASELTHQFNIETYVKQAQGEFK